MVRKIMAETDLYEFEIEKTNEYSCFLKFKTDTTQYDIGLNKKGIKILIQLLSKVEKELEYYNIPVIRLNKERGEK